MIGRVFKRWMRAALPAAVLAAMWMGLAGAAWAQAEGGASASLVLSQEEPDGVPSDLRLFNEYVAIIVNATEENTGRFAVETTGGNPERTTDDNSPLIYKQPGQSPWTSYATVRIDGIDYVFGGQPTERAGRAGLVGERVRGPEIVDDNRIETVYRMNGIEVLQTLTIIRSTTTGLLDTVRIAYRLENQSSRSRSVGLRLMLDTMLGANDGAPFRVEELAITSDTAFSGEQIPDFWQAFDSLSDPRVTSQGTLKGADLTTPDRVVFGNWGALADGLWDFHFEPGRDFTRLGEFELDSATALFWNPRPLAPGESRTYVTHYGLGGISISPGALSLGVTSPSTVAADPGREVTFPVIAYIQNTGEGDALNVVARINLPAGLKPASGERLERHLGTLPAGRTTQVTWRVALDRAVGGELEYEVGVSATNAESNQVRRRIRVVSPATLTLTIHDKNGRLRIEDDRWAPLPYRVAVTVENTGGADASDVVVRWESPLDPGLELARGDREEKPLGPLAAGEKVEVSWHIQPATASDRQSRPLLGNLPYAVKGRAAGVDEEFRAEGYLDVPPLESQIKVVAAPDRRGEPIRAGEYFLVEVRTQNVRSFYGAEVILSYYPRELELVGGALGVERGRLFVEAREGEGASGARYLGAWRPVVEADRARGTAAVRFGGERAGAVEESLFWVSDTLAVLRFRAVAPGVHSLTLDPVSRVYDRDNQGVIVRLADEKVTVVE